MRLRAATKLAAGLMVGVLLGACEDEYGPNVSGVPGFDIRWVEVTPGVDTVFVSDTIRASDRLVLQAAAYGVGSQRLPVGRFVWGTSDSSIAVVDSFGVVTPRRFGTVEISASATRIGKATVVVAPATRRVEIATISDTILIDEPVVAANSRLQLNARTVNEAGQTVTGSRVAWSVSPSSVASIDSTGLLRALAPGAAVVTAAVTSAGAQGQRTIQVLPSIRELRIGPAPAQVLAGDTVVLTTVATNYAGQPITRTVRWQTSNPSIASVDSTGRVIFVSTGSATITASSTYRTATVSITALGRELTAVSNGRDFSCGISRLGRLYCWGVSTFGETANRPDSACVGDNARPGTADCVLQAQRAAEPFNEYTAVATASATGCGIRNGGLLYCWGRGLDGELGIGRIDDSDVPLPATVLSERFTSLDGGGDHFCALNTQGYAYCWGRDDRGQLGDTLLVNSTTPIPVVGPDGLMATRLRFISIAAGSSHTCGVEAGSGAAWCWGEGSSGQRGDGTTDVRQRPRRVLSDERFRQISAYGNHTCAVTEGNALYCWGGNGFGQLGIGGAAQRNTPTLVGSGYSQVAAGADFTCATTVGGNINCWGNNQYGQLGRGEGTPTGFRDTPAPISIARSYRSVTAGARHACAIDSESQTWCWGSNIFGALGNGLQAAMRAVPERIAPLR